MTDRAATTRTFTYLDGRRSYCGLPSEASKSRNRFFSKYPFASETETKSKTKKTTMTTGTQALEVEIDDEYFSASEAQTLQPLFSPKAN